MAIWYGKSISSTKSIIINKASKYRNNKKKINNFLKDQLTRKMFSNYYINIVHIKIITHLFNLSVS